MAAFEPAYVFAGLAEAGGIRRGAGHVRQLTIFGGGAAGIWNIAAARVPRGHPGRGPVSRPRAPARPRPVPGVPARDRKQDWLAARLQDLGDGGVCAAARLYPLAGVTKAGLDTALGYFEHDAPPMRCNWFRSRGLFAGSGAVESGCQAVTGQRLKLPGMHGPAEGASAVASAALRCAASRPADPKTGSVTHRATRGQPPDQPDELAHRQI